MSHFLLIPLALQGGAILFDEFYYHMKRGLPQWERLGHPLDTLSFFACFAWTLLVPPTPAHIYIFLGLGVFSCLLVTKDELVHAKLCSPGEHWLHSVLFILHPACLLAAYQFWVAGIYRFIILIQVVAIALFIFYQIFYWRSFRKDIDE